MTEQSPFSTAPFQPTDDDTGSLLAWFDSYDDHVRRNEVEAMADMAVFPLTVITNDSAGEPVTRAWDRETFVRAMAMATGTPAEIRNERHPHFLGPGLAVVISDSTVTAGDQVQHMRYTDVLVRTAGTWRFSTMIQEGWGDMLRQMPAPAPSHSPS